MDLSIKTKDLQSALSLAAATTDRGKSTVPIVTQVFLTADGETLTIRSTDGERAMTSVVPCSVKLAGEASLNFSRLQSTVNLLTADDVRIKLNKNHRVEITSGKSTSRIPAEQFAGWPKMDPADGMIAELAAPSLANGIRQMMPIINAKNDGVIEISARTGVLRLVALNLASQHRFGVTEVACVAPEGFRLMIHCESAQAVRKMLLTAEGPVKIQLGVNGTSISIEDHTLYFLQRTSRIPDGLERVLQRVRENNFSVDAKEFLSAIKRTLNFSRGEKDVVAGITFAAKDGAVALSFAAQDCESNELVDAKLNSGNPSFKLNGDYVQTFVNEIWSKDVEFRFAAPKEPVWIKPSDAEYPLMIVSPIDPRM